MPLTVVATVGAADANSYASVADADEYLSFRIGAGAWATTYSADLKAQALVSATRDIDTLDVPSAQFAGFIGERATDTQALAWPRTGTSYADDELPTDLIAATIELAFLYAQQFTANGEIATSAANGNLKRKKVGPIEKEWFAPTAAAPVDVERFPASVQALLNGLLRVVGSLWGSASAVRGS